MFSEAKLVDEARRGNEEAFVMLYERYRTALFRFAWRMTGSIAAAEDVAHECFLALARGADFDGSRAPLRAYLFGIARHLVFRELRISGREEEERTEAAASPDVLENLLASERSELVRHAIASLPALQREAIILFEYEGLSLKNVATVTGADVGAIKARLARARDSLRKRLEPLLFPNAERSCS